MIRYGPYSLLSVLICVGAQDLFGCTEDKNIKDGICTFRGIIQEDRDINYENSQIDELIIADEAQIICSSE